MAQIIQVTHCKLMEIVEITGVQEKLPNPVLRQLKALAQKLPPATHVGKAGLSDAFLQNFEALLSVHELVKVRFMDFREEKHELAESMAVKTQSHLIWIVGHVVVFYRQNPDETKRKIKLG